MLPVVAGHPKSLREDKRYLIDVSNFSFDGTIYSNLYCIIIDCFVDRGRQMKFGCHLSPYNDE